MRSPPFSHSSSPTAWRFMSSRIFSRRCSSGVTAEAAFEDALLVRFFDILVVAGVDLDHVAFLDVEGNLHHRAALDLSRLGPARDGIALVGGVGLDDLGDDEGRGLDADRA